jgi:hypothetical protein
LGCVSTVLALFGFLAAAATSGAVSFVGLCFRRVTLPVQFWCAGGSSTVVPFSAPEVTAATLALADQ